MNSSGTLIAQVYTSYAQLPIENAVVTVTTPQEENPTLLAYRLTDSSGKTTPIELPAPPKADSESPNPSELPYANYFIRIFHREFEPILIKEAQVFAETQTIQEAELIPLEEYKENKDMTEIVNITPQNL